MKVSLINATKHSFVLDSKKERRPGSQDMNNCGPVSFYPTIGRIIDIIV